MDSNPLLSLFKEQLESECAAIGVRNGINDRGKQLIWWFFGRLHGFTDDEVEEVVCEGPNDLGVDAIWIDDDNDDKIVHFYQFKNPFKSEKVIPTVDVDKVISGLTLIIARGHHKVANEELRARIEEIYQRVPKGYRLHFVSSGGGIEQDAQLKLDAFTEKLRGAADRIFKWDVANLESVYDLFYRRTTPAVADPISFAVVVQPYMVRSASADSYFFHATGEFLASLFTKHGEGLLQRNIRAWQRDTATNRSIELTCKSDESGFFLHYNNGITFLGESADWLPFNQQLIVNKAQVVNGGQTIRALAKARGDGELKSNVLVPVRVITSSGNKEFASNVAVNQNNQNQMRTGFLRSNDPRIVQLGYSLESSGWYLERREGELGTLNESEIAVILQRIRRPHPIEQWVIKLKDGIQAYVATFGLQPELAKKNPAKMFLSATDGGIFDSIFSSALTAEKMIVAHQIKCYVDEFVKQFMTRKRRRDRVAEEVWKKEYRDYLGDAVVDAFIGDIDQVVPQCAVFVCGTVYQDLADFQNVPVNEIVNRLTTDGQSLIRSHLYYIMEFIKQKPDQKNKSWPTLLKSSTFFEKITAYIRGLRVGGANGKH